MKLEIKEPCNEDWNNMKIGMISRHCDVCEKGVMDFTKMNRAEIITYLLSNPNDQVCGRMNKDQFDFRHEDIPVLVETLKRQRTPNPFLILALVCLSLSSCAQEQPASTTHIKTPPPIEKHVLGKMAMPIEDTNHVQVVKDSIPDEVLQLQGEIVCEPEVMVGDIEVPVAGGIGIVHEPDPEINEPRVLQFAEKMPEFEGGMDSLFSFINANVAYPKYELDNNIQGNVYVRFVVEEDGSITRPEILRTVTGSKFLSEEVIRLINSMPKWVPGENHGKKVATYMTLPIRFSLK